MYGFVSLCNDLILQCYYLIQFIVGCLPLFNLQGIIRWIWMAVRMGAIPSDFHVQSQKFKTCKLNLLTWSFKTLFMFMNSYDKI